MFQANLLQATVEAKAKAKASEIAGESCALLSSGSVAVVWAIST